MIKIIFKKQIIVILLATVLISAWLYRLSFSSYFFQDDWFSFRISEVKNLNHFLSFFIPRKDVIYYRPLGMQIPYFILNNLFGLNPLPFRIAVLTTHAVNIFLVFILIFLLVKKEETALLAAFLYGTSAVHFLIFYWFAIYAFILGPTFFFLSFILYIYFLQNKKKMYYFLSFIVFLCGLAANEIVAILPIILFFYEIFLRKKFVIKRLTPYLFFVLIILVIRFVFFTPPSFGVYRFSIGRHIFSNLKTYLLWSFNWSEKLTEQMTSLFIFNDKITSLFYDYALIILFTSTIIFLLFYLLPFIFILKSRKIKSFLGVILLGNSWFIAGLLPILFFSDHKFSYYLPISLVGLLLVSLSFYNYLIRKVYNYSKWLSYFLLCNIVVVWLWSAVATIDFNTKNHWAPYLAYLSKELVNKAKIDMVRKHSLADEIYIPYLQENKFALNDQDAFKVVFGREDIVTIYKKEK